MKKYVVLILLFLVIQAISGVVLKPTDQITCAARTIYNDGNLALPDSVRIQVFKNGSELSDNWYNSSDAEASAVDDWLLFTDQFQDIDGNGGEGQYIVLCRGYDKDSTLYTPFIYNFQVGLDVNIAAISNDSAAADSLEEVYNGNGATMNLTQLNIQSDGNKIALNLNGSGTGSAILAQGGEYSKAVLFKGGVSTSGPGLEIVGGGNNGTALLITGSGTGKDIDADIYGSLSGSVGSVSGTVVPTDTVSGGGTIAIKDDSLIYQGDFSVLSTEIADSLKNRDSLIFSEGFWHKIANRSDSGSVSSEQGIYSFTLTVIDSANSQTVSGVKVSVQNLNQTTLAAFGYTDINGIITMNLYPDSFLVNSFAPGYIFNAYDTIVVSADYSDSLFGYNFDPGMPSSPGLCRVYGYLFDINGTALENINISASLPGGVVRYGGSIISPFEITTATDTSGYFTLDLIPSVSLNPTGELYEFTITISDGTILRQRLEVPDLTNWQISW
jgi:hypothetical protein